MTPTSRRCQALAKQGATGASSVDNFIAKLKPQRSVWLMVPAAMAVAKDSTLSEFTGRVCDSGEGGWTLLAAVEEGSPAPVLSAALYQRFTSRG